MDKIMAKYKKLCKDFDTTYCYDRCNWFEQCVVREMADEEAVYEKDMRDMRRKI